MKRLCFFLLSYCQVRASDAPGPTVHWPIQLLAHGNFQNSRLQSSDVVYHELDKHSHLSQMQKVVSEHKNKLMKQVELQAAWRLPPSFGRLLQSVWVIYVNISSLRHWPHFDSDILEKDSFLLHFKAVYLAQKIAALNRSLYTCLGKFCSNFCFGHKSKITAVRLWVHWTLRACWLHHQPEGITNN